MSHNVNKSKIYPEKLQWTGRYQLEFTDPVDERYVRALSKTILEARPLEMCDTGVAMDWSWIVKLRDETELDRIQQSQRVQSIEREMAQGLQFEMN